MIRDELGEIRSTNEDIRNVYNGTRALGKSLLAVLGGNGMIILKLILENMVLTKLKGLRLG
jgi:hypothetical protein